MEMPYYVFTEQQFLFGKYTKEWCGNVKSLHVRKFWFTNKKN